MKYILKTIMVVFLTSLAYSCSEDFLVQKSPDMLASENFWRNQTDAEAGLAAAYSQLESSAKYWEGFQEGRQIMKQYRSDYVVYGADASNYASWTDIYNFTYTFGNPNLYYLWSINYAGINYANQVISNVSKMTDEQIDVKVRDEIVGEARFLRAYYHFELLQFFKDVILRDEEIFGDNINKAPSPRTEVWDFIINDFESASKVLVPKQDNKNTGRATKYTALAYLGKAYLYRAGEDKNNAADYFKKAADAFKPIVNDGYYSLVDDYLSMWDGTVSNSPESLFEFQMTPNEDNGAYYKFVLYYFYGANEFGGWEEILGTNALLNEMKKEGQIAGDGNYDHRLYWNCYFNDPYFNDPETNMVYGKTYNDWFGADNDKICFRKYLPADVSGFDIWGLALNVPLMRYADVLLMYAEALNESGQTSQAIPLINQVRERADMPGLTITGQEAVREQIKHERVMELTLEGGRFFDLRRWGDLEKAMQEAGRENFNLSEHSYMPIPEAEVNANSEIN